MVLAPFYQQMKEKISVRLHGEFLSLPFGTLRQEQLLSLFV
jgi:hypothetical protein